MKTAAVSELQYIPPAEGPRQVPLLFRAERDRLLDLLSDLSPADWGRPTPCPGWTVLDLCRHLVGDDFSALSWHRDEHRGTNPPAGTGEAGFVDWLDELQREWVLASRRLSPRLVCELLAWTGPQLVETFRLADPGARTAHVSWAGPDPVPVWLDHVRELSEHWIHRQQLLEALGRAADLDEHLDNDPLLVILDGFRWAYPYRLGESGLVATAGGDHVVIEVTPTGPVWTVAVDEEGRWGFAPLAGGRGREVGRVTMPANAAWRLLTNNLDASRRSGLHASGDPAVVNILLRTRAIVGRPNDMAG